MQKQIGVNNSDMRSQKAASRTISYRRSMFGVRSDVATNWRYFRGCQTSARLISPGSYRKTIAPVWFSGNKVKVYTPSRACVLELSLTRCFQAKMGLGL